MSDSISKYNELLEEGKISNEESDSLFLSKKEENVIKIIKFGRTVVKHELDFEVATFAIELLEDHPEMSELQAIELSMVKFDIL